ncbi:hypothetical protein, partial [Denitromonas sp.]|uniref:hypothetical protein n=1 Tax=Denitromonas sp. TaxID=2734609 RepID=UPI001E0F4CDD|nr:hypothetical protein [Rhodocyclaceae bacterium]
MPRYAHADFLDGGSTAFIAACDVVYLVDAYTTSYATASGSAKIGQAALVPGDFSVAGADGAARVMTLAISGKSAGNAAKAVPDGTNMHLVFCNIAASKVLYVTEESTDQPVTLGNPVSFNSSPT